MQMIIDVPEDKVKALKYLSERNMPLGCLEKAVLNGTTLPENHGRLIDVDKAMDEIYWGNNDLTFFGFGTEVDVKVTDFLKSRPTLVDAKWGDDDANSD